MAATMSDIERLTSVDIERQASAKAKLANTSVHNFAWQNVSVKVKDRVTKQPKMILENVNGLVNAGTYQPRCSVGEVH